MAATNYDSAISGSSNGKVFGSAAATYEPNVFDFSGSVSGLNTAISLSKYNGKLIAGSMYAEANSDLKLGKEFHWNNIKIISSRAVNEPYSDYPSWNKNRVSNIALKIINSEFYQFNKIISKKFL